MTTTRSTSLLIFLTLAAVSAQVVQLDVKELRQVRLPSDLTGVNQNVSVVLDTHDPVDAGGLWTLSLLRIVNGTNNEVNYDCSSVDEDQTTIDCEGNLIDASALVMSVENESDETVPLAFGYLVANITDFGSRAAWVGDSSGGDQAFLRVHTGTLDKVEVDGVEGNLTCSPGNTTCYYQQAQVLGQPEDLTVSRCKDVDTNKNTIQHCDDVVGLFPPLSEDPEFILSLGEGSQQLSITYSTDADTLELVADEVDFQTCKDDNNACSFDVTLQEDQKTLQRTLVFLNSKNYVTSALNFDMEVYKISIQRVTTDSLRVEWDDASPGRYLVTVAETSRDPTTQIVGCNGTLCHTYFTTIALGPSVKISVKKEEENKTVTFDQEPEDPPPSSTLEQVIRVVMDSIVTVVNVSGATVTDPATATVVLVRSRAPLTFSVDYVMDWQGELTPTTDGFAAQFDVDVLDEDGRFDFLVVLYKSDGQVESAASVTLQISDTDLNVDLVGSSGKYVRVTTTSGTELSVNNVEVGSCTTSSPCYLPQELPEVTVCTTSATPPLLCQQNNPTPPQEMSSNLHIELVKDYKSGEDVLRVTNTYDVATTNVEVYLSEISKLQTCDSATDPCEVTLDTFPDNFDVVVTGFRADGEVVESTTVSFQDLYVVTEQLRMDMMEVRWSSVAEEVYIVTLSSVSGSQRHGAPRTPLDNTTRQVTCGTGSEICVSHFTNLTENSYNVSVHRQGDDSTSVTDIYETESDFDKPPAWTVTKVSSVSNEETRVSVDEKPGNDVDVVLSVQQGSGPEISVVGELVPDHSPTTYVFNHDQQLLSSGATDFLLVAHDSTDNGLSGIAETHLTLSDVETMVAWVGAEPGNSSASLRVEGGAEGVTASWVCMATTGACYLLEVGGAEEASEAEVCWLLKDSLDDHDVSQCTHQASNFTAFTSEVAVSIEDGSLKVSMVEDWTGNVEVVAYNPEDKTSIYTDTDQSCLPRDKDQPYQCYQQLKERSAQRMKVLVTATDDSNIVTSSTLMTVYNSYQPSGTEDWVIVVSVLCSVFGVAIIVFVAVIVVKKKQAKKQVSAKEAPASPNGEDGAPSVTNLPPNPLTAQTRNITPQQPLNGHQHPYIRHQPPNVPHQPPNVHRQSSGIYEELPSRYLQPTAYHHPPANARQPPQGAWNARDQPLALLPLPRPSPVTYDEWGSRPLGGHLQSNARSTVTPPSTRYERRFRY